MLFEALIFVMSSRLTKTTNARRPKVSFQPVLAHRLRLHIRLFLNRLHLMRVEFSVRLRDALGLAHDLLVANSHRIIKREQVSHVVRGVLQEVIGQRPDVPDRTVSMQHRLRDGLVSGGAIEPELLLEDELKAAAAIRRFQLPLVSGVEELEIEGPARTELQLARQRFDVAAAVEHDFADLVRLENRAERLANGVIADGEHVDDRDVLVVDERTAHLNEGNIAEAFWLVRLQWMDKSFDVACDVE